MASDGLGLSHILATGLETVGQEVVLGQHLFMDCAEILDQTFRVVESCLQIDTFKAVGLTLGQFEVQVLDAGHDASDQAPGFFQGEV